MSIRTKTQPSVPDGPDLFFLVPEGATRWKVGASPLAGNCRRQASRHAHRLSRSCVGGSHCAHARVGPAEQAQYVMAGHDVTPRIVIPGRLDTVISM